MAARQFIGFKGQTLHSWSGIKTGNRSNMDMLETVINSQAAQNIRNADVLIIDEISMLSRHIFDQLEYIVKNVRNSDSLFGGLQVIASGCFKQLAPVPDERKGDIGEFCFISENFKKIFRHHINLTDVQRQKEPDLIKAVQELCDGNPSESTKSLISSLQRPIDSTGHPIHLVGTNLSASILNASMLEAEGDTDITEYRSVDEGPASKLGKCSAVKVLRLKVGAPVILIQTISETLVNGSRGTVYKVDNEAPTVEFSGNLIKLQRCKFLENNSTRFQFPIKLGYALTVHRAQGQTLDTVIVHCKDFFAPGHVGVALGRARSKSGLQVLDFSDACGSIPHPQSVYDFYAKASKPTDHPVSTKECCTMSKCKSLGTMEPLQPVPSTSIFHPCVIQSNDDEINEIRNVISIKKPFNDIQFKFNNTLAQLSDSNIRQFINKCQARFPPSAAKIPELNSKLQTDVYSNLHQLLISDEFESWSMAMFCTRELDATQRKISSKIVQTYHELTIQNFSKKKSESNKSNESNSNLPSTACASTNDVPMAVQSKIRYLGGACIAKLRYSYRNLLQNDLFSKKHTDIVQQHVHELQVKLCDQIISSEHDIHVTTEFPDTLCETDEKQNVRHGLTNISDSTYLFFTEIHKYLMTVDMDKLCGKDILPNLTSLLYTNANLLEAWLSLTENIETDESDWYVHVQLSVFDRVMNWFGKVWVKEFIIPKKGELVKKSGKGSTASQALRPYLKGASKKVGGQSEVPSKGKGSTSKRTQPKKTRAVRNKKGRQPVAVEFPCRICHSNCGVGSRAVGCDGCEQWLHYECLDIDSDDPDLDIDPWYCPECKN
jgi:ATP-dependent DNA helicase PIF1